MNFTDRDVTLTLTGFVIFGLLAGAWVLYQQGKDLGYAWDETAKLRDRVDHLEARLTDIIDWAWESSPHDRPQPELEPEAEPVTAPIDVAPATTPSDAADMFARKAWLSRRSYHGTHHTDSGGVPASEFYKVEETS